MNSKVVNFSFKTLNLSNSLPNAIALVSLGMRVLSVDDLGFTHKGGSLFMSYLQAKEQLAAMSPRGTFSTLGIGGIP